MRRYHFPGPGQMIVTPDPDLVRSAIQKLQRGENISQGEATDFLDWLASETRRNLKEKLKMHFEWAGTPGEPDLSPENIENYCGFVESLGTMTLTDLGIAAKPFATQKLPDYFHGHVGYTVELPIENERKIFLVDTTFRQFCGENKCVDAVEDPDPGYYLSREKNGHAILDELLSQGYIELTPSVAAKYLRSFCQGAVARTDKEAMHFFRHPPANNMCGWFSREYFDQLGLGIRVPDLDPVLT